jgi:hypothetical protein
LSEIEDTSLAFSGIDERPALVGSHDMSKRYGVYFTPRIGTALWAFGEALLGSDRPQASRNAIADDARVVAAGRQGAFADPSRYGFHATLKAPFELSAERSERDLLDAVRQFAGRQPSLPLGRLSVTEFGPYLALMTSMMTPQLRQLEAAIVCDFEPFRAPLSPTDRERRLKAALDPTERHYLDHWGYPYVLDRFRFHMTLAGPLTPSLRAELAGALRELYAPFDALADLDGIAVVCQPDRTSPFVIIERFDFVQGSSRGLHLGEHST